MDPFFRPTRIEISCDALSRNIQAFRSVLPPRMKILAVVKANAYGHGAVEIAKQALRDGVDYLGVAFLDEAIELRQAGIEGPILVLGYTPPHGLRPALEHRIALTVYSRDVLQAMEAMPAAGDGRRLAVHVKIDTGMGRLGLANPEEAISFIDRLLDCPGVKVEGLYTHFARADEVDKAPTRQQFERLRAIVDHYRKKNRFFDVVHAGNTAAAMDTPEFCFNMVRLGIGMYGLYPSEEVNRSKVRLEPVMRFVTGVVMVKNVPPGTPVSYGGTYVTSREERIVTLPVGYGDGYSRLLTGKSEVLIHGRRKPVIGRICMDQCMVEANDLDVQLGDEVVLIGRQGDECITADELANRLGTIPYEIICMVSNRVPKVYYRNGERIAVVNALVH